MMEGTEDLPAAEANNSGKKKINKMKNKRRFSDEQVRLLETIFESETRLDPRKKQQVARDLGLQPQQVAIWFQNRRARWKSKQIEHQYRLLKADYDNLASQFEALKKEKQSLLIQLQNLSEFAGKHSNRSSPIKDLEGSKADGGSVNEKTKCDPELKPGFSRRGLDYDGFMCPRNDNTRDLELYREEGRDQLLNVGDQTNGSSTSAEKWHSFDSGGSFDQSCNSSLWFWTSGAEAYSLLP